MQNHQRELELEPRLKGTGMASEMRPWGQVSDGNNMGNNEKVMHSGSSENIMKLPLGFEGRPEQEEEGPCLEVKAGTVSTIGCLSVADLLVGRVLTLGPTRLD